ncbi:MAG: outer membrane lipoprotein carrier protein LolA [Bacteroidales bacterium]|nr:outer membrane lipoprotein carrier protein LolA [Bacteroidales bacterium]
MNTTNPQAKAVVDKAIAAISQNAYEGKYTITFVGPDEKTKQTVKGEVKLWKEKFYYHLADVEMFYDGKTEWTYIRDLNEVSITEPTAEELGNDSPMMMMRGYGKSHRVDFDPVPSDDNYYYVSVYPTNHSLDYFRIQLVVNKKNYMLRSIKMSQRNGDRITLLFDALTMIPNPTLELFTFSKESHPKVTVTDLR